MGQATRLASAFAALRRDQPDFISRFIFGGGAGTWENLMRSDKAVNARKGDRLPHEAGLKLLHGPRTPKELPATALFRDSHGVPELKPS